MLRAVLRPSQPYPLHQLTEKLRADPPRFSFVVLGNTDLAREASDKGDVITAFDRIMADIRSLNPQPQFIFHLGDVAEEAGDMATWEELIRRSSPFEVGFDQGDLSESKRKLCFVLPGDRDVCDKRTEDEFLERFPRPSGNVQFSFDWEEFHFIALNSETIDDSWLMEYFGFNRKQNRITGPQWTWLQGDLRKNQGKEIVVFIHKPLFPQLFSRNDGYCLDQYYSDRERLLDLLNRYSVKVIFAGHEPIFHWARIQSTYHIITGGAGRKPKIGRWLGGFYHFLYVTIDEASRMDIYCVDPERNTVETKLSVT